MRRFLALALLGAIILAGPAGAFKTFRAFGGAVHEGAVVEPGSGLTFFAIARGVAVAVGETATLTAKVTGGQQPYLFAWYVNGGKVLQGAIPTIAVTPDKPGRRYPHRHL